MSQAPLMLSVSGMRGWVGQSLTPVVVTRYAAAFGHWLHTTTDQPPHVVLGRDSRPSGPMFEAAAVAGLVATGCKVTRLGIVSTPGVAIMTEHLRAHGGMVITASHNPILWNGIKALRHDGVALSVDQAQTLIEIFHNQAAQLVGIDQIQPIEDNVETVAVHGGRIFPHLDVAAIRDAKLTAVVDSVHGAGGAEAKALLDHLGVKIVHLYAQPTGQFPHMPEPTRENLVGLCQVVEEHHADIGFAQDPDADRLAIVDDRGTYIGEEYTLALCAAHLLKANQTVVTNLSTSRMVDDLAQAVGASVLRTPVGEANVALAMKRIHASLGGEGNGGIIWPKLIHVRDSLAGMAIVLEMLAKQGKKLSQLVAGLPAYAIVKDKVPLDPQVADRLVAIMQKVYAGQRVDVQDGVRVDWDDRWVHVRPSNTEPILRVIAEAVDASIARTLIDDVKGHLNL